MFINDVNDDFDESLSTDCTRTSFHPTYPPDLNAALYLAVFDAYDADPCRACNTLIIQHFIP